MTSFLAEWLMAIWMILAQSGPWLLGGFLRRLLCWLFGWLLRGHFRRLLSVDFRI